MHQVAVKGEIRSLACREGSSGIFSGTIAGLYQGYRIGGSEPDRREYTLTTENGAIALVLLQQVVAHLAPRPAEHPFAGGRDPFESLPALPPGGGGPPAAAARAPSGGAPLGLQRPDIRLSVLPAGSSGIFAGASGDLELRCPAYRVAGYLVVDTEHGSLHLSFLEDGDRTTLMADLKLDGGRSTGIYRGAEGELRFELARLKPGYGKGAYEGTLRLAQPPPST